MCPDRKSIISEGFLNWVWECNFHSFKASNTHSVGRFFDSLLLNTFLEVFIPNSLSVDENMFTISKLTRTEFQAIQNHSNCQ